MIDSPISDATVKRDDKTSTTPQFIQSAFFGIFFFAATFLTVLGSLYAISNNPSRVQQAYPILLSNLTIIILLGLYLGVRVWNILFAKRFRRAAPLLHRRFVLIFSLAALTPAILVGGFSTSLISKNFNDLFGDNVRNTLERADQFLTDYLAQEYRELGSELTKAKRFLEQNQPYMKDRISFTAYLRRYALSLEVDSLIVLDNEGRVYSRVISPSSPELEIPTSFILDAVEKEGRFAFLKRDDIDYLLAINRLEGYENTYVMGGRYLNPNVGVLSSIKGIDEAELSLDKYNRDQGIFRKSFLLTFFESALLILYAAISLGILLANRIIKPLGDMVETAEQIRGGDLSARVKVKGDWGEMSDLGSALNRMTRQLGSQREDLIREHSLSERRRQFSEAVLSGVRAGVIGLSEEGRITLTNASAEHLIGRESSELLGQHIDLVLPEFAKVFASARESVTGGAEDQINFDTEDGIRNFDLRASSYEADDNDTGWVLTFDDMTRLIAAQRYSAWREVARRIAHEIKNPLTPILLSAERLKRKYSSEISTDPEIFDNCTDTIIRQVGSLEQMVNEFSSFARMPAPEFEIHKFSDIVKHILFAQGVAFPDVTFEFQKQTVHDNIYVSCDERLISQALTNVYKNAAESITERVDRAGIDEPDGVIVTQLEVLEDQVVLGVSDNGRGWPLPDKHRLLEPYVTTRATGTGLGLAIVKRIAEDHGGHFKLSERPDGLPGAHVEFSFPAISKNSPYTSLKIEAKTHEA